MVNRTISRRNAIKVGSAALIPLLSGVHLGDSHTEFPPIRTVTRGPKYHWFGYYDKAEFDPTDRYLLSNQVDFEHRAPNTDRAGRNPGGHVRHTGKRSLDSVG